MPEGEYEFEISFVGYKKKTLPVKVPSDTPLTAIGLESTAATLIDVGLIEYLAPLMDVTAPGTVQGTEIEGVQVKIQY